MSVPQLHAVWKCVAVAHLGIRAGRKDFSATKNQWDFAASLHKTRMWANAQRDDRPAEYRWRPLFNAAKFG